MCTVMGLTKKNWCKVDTCVCVCAVYPAWSFLLCVCALWWFPCCCNWLTSCRKEAKEAREKVAEEERKREEARKVCVMLLTLSCRICDSELSHSLYCSRGVCQGGWADFLKPEGQQGLEACHVSSTICVGYTEVVYRSGVFVFIVVMVHRYWWFPIFSPSLFHFTSRPSSIVAQLKSLMILNCCSSLV